MIMMPYGRCRSSLQLTGTQTSGTPQAQAGTHPPEPVNLAEHRISRNQVLGGLAHE